MFSCICRFLTSALIGWVQMDRRYVKNGYTHYAVGFLLQKAYFSAIFLACSMLFSYPMVSVKI